MPPPSRDPPLPHGAAALPHGDNECESEGTHHECMRLPPLLDVSFEYLEHRSPLPLPELVPTRQPSRPEMQTVPVEPPLELEECNRELHWGPRMGVRMQGEVEVPPREVHDALDSDRGHANFKSKYMRGSKSNREQDSHEM